MSKRLCVGLATSFPLVCLDAESSSTEAEPGLADVSPVIAAVCEGSLPGWRHGPGRTPGLCRVAEAPGLFWESCQSTGPSPLGGCLFPPPALLGSVLGASPGHAQQCQEAAIMGQSPRRQVL